MGFIACLWVITTMYVIGERTLAWTDGNWWAVVVVEFVWFLGLLAFAKLVDEA